MTPSRPQKKCLKGSSQLLSSKTLAQIPQEQSVFVYLRALRVRQWTKNLIVFAAPLFAFKLTSESLSGGLPTE
jgi:decaprenyl-phosphate phosphoribosyltransferase